MEEKKSYRRLMHLTSLNKITIGVFVTISVLMFLLLAFNNLNNIEAEKDAAVSFEKMIDFLQSGDYFEAIEIAEKLQEKESEIYKKHQKLKDELRTHIESFNFNNKVNLVLGYHNQLDFREDDYGLKRKISDKLAIALLEKGSTDRLPEIIKEISEESV